MGLLDARMPGIMLEVAQPVMDPDAPPIELLLYPGKSVRVPHDIGAYFTHRQGTPELLRALMHAMTMRVQEVFRYLDVNVTINSWTDPMQERMLWSVVGQYGLVKFGEKAEDPLSAARAAVKKISDSLSKQAQGANGALEYPQRREKLNELFGDLAVAFQRLGGTYLET